jgi:predicted nucleotidyltransferase
MNRFRRNESGLWSLVVGHWLLVTSGHSAEVLWQTRIWRLCSYLLYLSMNIEEPKIRQIQELCEENKVKSLYAFGSVTREDFDDLSDIDLVVDFEEKDPFTYTDLYLNLKLELETLLKRQVDLLEERAIKNPIFRERLENTKVKIYGY